MSDIVKRLVDTARAYSGSGMNKLLVEAADEIERFTTEVGRLESVEENLRESCRISNERIEKLTEDRERLRAELEDCRNKQRIDQAQCDDMTDEAGRMAVEIEDLRAELAEARTIIGRCERHHRPTQSGATEAVELAEENRRLRAELERVRTDFENCASVGMADRKRAQRAEDELERHKAVLVEVASLVRAAMDTAPKPPTREYIERANEALRVFAAEGKTAEELNEWYEKRCQWYQGELQRRKVVVEAAVPFILWCCEQLWDGMHIDGGDCQDKMEELGLIKQIETPPDSEWYGEADFIYVPSEALRALDAEGETDER